VVRFDRIGKAFGERVVYDGLQATVERGQRVAVVGANGTGKTTLLKLAAGELEPDAGEVSLGPSVSMAYYAQHHAEALDRKASILDEVSSRCPDKPQSYVRGVLGAFLFSGDDVEKKIGVLSGGERARVALATLLVRPANLLLMDEPTNHLDLASAEALIEALQGYSGTLLFVSHNKSFLNRLASHVWEVRDRTVIPYPGNLDDYLRHVRALALQQDEGEARPGAGAEAAPSARERRRAEAEARQRRSAREGPLKEEIARLEAQIAVRESEQAARQRELADPVLYQDFARAKPLLDAHRATQAELEVLYSEWEDRQTRLAALAANPA
jgi:ATP-binding cassette subfamily F protein 3